MPNQEELFTEDIRKKMEAIVDDHTALVEKYSDQPMHKCTRGCRTGNHTFKVGEKARLIEKKLDHFGAPVVILELEDGSRIEGSQMLFSNCFIFIHK